MQTSTIVRTLTRTTRFFVRVMIKVGLVLGFAAIVGYFIVGAGKDGETHTDQNGNLIQVHKEYWPDGMLKKAIPYKVHVGLGYRSIQKRLVPHGIVKVYYPDGTLKAEDPYVDGKREGELKFYDETGRLVQIEEYRNDKRNGPFSLLRDLGNGNYIETYEIYRDDQKIEGPLKRTVSAETLRQRYGKLRVTRKAEKRTDADPTGDQPTPIQDQRSKS